MKSSTVNLFIAILFALLPSVQAKAQANDNCANATAVAVGTTCITTSYNSAGATFEPTAVAADPSCGSYTNGDVWFSFVVPASGYFRIEMSLSYGRSLALYSGSCGSFIEETCAASSSNGGDISFFEPGLSGQTVYLRTWTSGNPQADGFSLCIFEFIPPANDACSNATPISVGTSCVYAPYSSRNSSSQPTSVAADPSCASYQGSDVWFTFTVPSSGGFRIDMNQGNASAWALYSGTCGNFTEFECASSTLPKRNFNEPTLAGQTLYLRSWRNNSVQGEDFTLCITETSSPANDNCANAISIAPSTLCIPINYSSIYASSEGSSVAANPSCGLYQEADAWFSFVVPVTGQVLIKRNNLSGGDFYYTLNTGTCGSFTEIYCSNDAQYLIDDISLAGQTLFLRTFHSNTYWGGGEFELCLVVGQDCEGTFGGTAIPGSSCDDNDGCTINDVYDGSCNCAGTYADTDGDGTCDANDLCPGGPEPGTSCDDNDPATDNDVILADCSCIGIPSENTGLACADGIDNDGDGFIDCDDPECQALNSSLGCSTCFNDGLSFADEVLEYFNNCSGNSATDSSQALGVPNFTTVADKYFVSLGDGGFVKLLFNNNTLTNSGDASADLYIFEVGPIVEASSIELRPIDAGTESALLNAGLADADLDGYYEIGAIGGSTESLDIDAVVPGAASGSLFFDAVKIVDDPSGCSTATPGADIDGVCALSSIDCIVGASCDDNDPCTANDVLLGNCNCAGTFQDGDNDGICDANDTEDIASSCVDGLDNDGNGLVDCEDPACQAYLGTLQACSTCFGDLLSFADSVDGYVNACPNNQATDPSNSLGAPDYVPGSDTNFVSLGNGGQINLYFTDNTLNNSGNSEPDLFVFEEGPLVEGSAIELRPLDVFTEVILINAGLADIDLDGFYEFDTIQGSTASVDIDAVVIGQPAATLFFDAIQIVDLPSSCATATPGADIDAVCAISSVPCAVGTPCDDGDPLTLLDAFQEDCVCAGIICTPGAPCDDGNACTTGEVFQADCSCSGGTPTVCPSTGIHPCEYTFCVAPAGCQSDAQAVSCNQVLLDLKVMLEGPYNNGSGLMNDDLRAASLIPLDDPYQAMGYTHFADAYGNWGHRTTSSSALGVTGSSAVVDWVIVELRNTVDPTVIEWASAALLLRDGTIANEDGSVPFAMTAWEEAYHVAIKHRNHLGVMHGISTTLSWSSPTAVDFTSPSTPFYGVEAQKNIGGVMTLYSGNVDPDTKLKYVGADNDRDPILVEIGGSIPTSTTTGYRLEDTNMDGVIKYVGSNNDRDPILVNIGGSVPTNVRVEQLP